MYESSACEDHKSVVMLTCGTISTNLETQVFGLHDSATDIDHSASHLEYIVQFSYMYILMVKIL